MLYRLTVLLTCLVCIRASAQQASPTGSEHFREVGKRGDQGKGFCHEMTSYHFLLFQHGGAIEIEADDPSDSGSKEAIRDLFVKIAGKFSQGDFDLPMLIRAPKPTGVETMKRLKNAITYAVEVTQKGARLRIVTENAQAIEAIYDFLRFQIIDHRTKDSLEVQKSAAADRADSDSQ